MATSALSAGTSIARSSRPGRSGVTATDTDTPAAASGGTPRAATHPAARITIDCWGRYTSLTVPTEGISPDLDTVAGTDSALAGGVADQIANATVIATATARTDPHFTATSNPPGSMIAGVCHGVPVSARFVAIVPGTAQVSGADNRTK